MTASTVLPGVHRLGSALVNWYLVEDEGRLTAIDAGLPGFKRQLEAYLESLGRRLDDVEAVVLTHSDSDHTGLAPRSTSSGTAHSSSATRSAPGTRSRAGWGRR